MTVERSKRRSLLALTFIAKSTSKNLLFRKIRGSLYSLKMSFLIQSIHSLQEQDLQVCRPQR